LKKPLGNLSFISYISYGANFLWVMILALLGPSLPGIIEELGIDYARAGVFFAIVSAGSLFGTSIGSIASDYVNRKALFIVAALTLSASLLLITLSASFGFLVLVLGILSVAGSPIGAIGQGMMLYLFPERHEKNLSIQGIFTAVGSFLAPVMVSASYLAGGTWRFAFLIASLIGLLLVIGIFPLRIPAKKSSAKPDSIPDYIESEGRIKRLAEDKEGKRGKRGIAGEIIDTIRVRGVLFSFSMLLVYVGVDFGFSYWLSEYMRMRFLLSLSIASGSVLFYLIGVISGRLLNARLVGRIDREKILKIAPVIAAFAFGGFILAKSLYATYFFIILYGFGISPLFPLLLAYGTGMVPERPGTTTGILFASLSLGGILFPPLIGLVANHLGLNTGYLVIPVLLLILELSFLLKLRKNA